MSKDFAKDHVPASIMLECSTNLECHTPKYLHLTSVGSFKSNLKTYYFSAGF